MDEVMEEFQQRLRGIRAYRPLDHEVEQEPPAKGWTCAVCKVKVPFTGNYYHYEGNDPYSRYHSEVIDPIVDAHKRLHGHTCKLCGKWENNYWMEPTRSEMAAEQLCFTCNHFLGLLPTDGRKAIIDHTHYTIGEEPKPGVRSHWLGFAGRQFTIRFHTGRVVVTHNLWCQGDIPEHLWPQLPDNAVWLTTKELGEKRQPAPAPQGEGKVT